MHNFFSQEYRKHARASSDEIRTAGVAVMIVLLGIGAVVHTVTRDVFGIYPTLFGIGLSIGVCAQFFPWALRPLYVLWMMFAAILGWVNTRVILGVIFFGMFTPIALFFRMIGRDPLARKWSAKESYRVVSMHEEGSTMKDPF